MTVYEGPVTVQPTRYIVTALPEGYESVEDWQLFAVTVQYRGGGRWGVYKGAYDYSSLPSSRRIIAGDYVPEEDALTGFHPTTQRGRDFVNGTGEFAPEQEKPDAGSAEAQA